jgi:hypothetical protein
MKLPAPVIRFFLVLGIACVLGMPALAEGRLEAGRISSASFKTNKVGVSPERRITVYLPPNYDTNRRFPVIYFLNSFDEDETAPFANHDAKALLDQAISSRVIDDVIVVTADFTTPMGTSWYVNSPVTGNWQDFMVKELVPWVDAHYRTLARPESRGIAGDRMGGYGAIRFGMACPDVFGSVYALHPVGTGTGVQTMHSRPDWDRLYAAKSLADFKDDLFGRIFLSIYQGALPNPQKPPLYVDLPARRENGQLIVDSALTARLIDNFALERQLPRYADNLKRLRAFKFDWGRNDTNYDHVYANQAFAHKLDEFGVPYEAEEFHGWWGERHWGPDGRVMTDVLPFFARHLVFEP